MRRLPKVTGRRRGAAIVWIPVLLLLATAPIRVHGDGPRRVPGDDRDRKPVASFEAGRFFGDRDDRTNRSTPAESLRLPAGFRAELIYTVPREQQGSWVCLTSDSQGRLIASAQSGKLYRITLPAGGAERASPIRVEPIDLDIGSAQGLVWAFGSLYIVANAPARSGLYRVRDTDGDDRFDRVEELRRFDGEGEHGPHGVSSRSDPSRPTRPSARPTRRP